MQGCPVVITCPPTSAHPKRRPRFPETPSGHGSVVKGLPPSGTKPDLVTVTPPPAPPSPEGLACSTMGLPPAGCAAVRTLDNRPAAGAVPRDAAVGRRSIPSGFNMFHPVPRGFRGHVFHGHSTDDPRTTHMSRPRHSADPPPPPEHPTGTVQPGIQTLALAVFVAEGGQQDQQARRSAVAGQWASGAPPTAGLCLKKIRGSVEPGGTAQYRAQVNGCPRRAGHGPARLWKDRLAFFPKRSAGPCPDRQ
eukprot:gene24507-biopygen5934